MQKPIYIVGHKNPDTDSICAAVAYANLKSELGYMVIPCRAGEMNRETSFVLDYFGIEQPPHLTDLHCRVKDLLSGENILIRSEISVLEAWKLMRSNGIKTLPVVDKNDHLLGLVTAGDLAEKYLTDLGDLNLSEIRVNVHNVLKTLGGTLLNGSPETQLNGKLIVWSGVLEGQGNPGCIALVGEEWDEQEDVIKSGAACMVLTGGAALMEQLMDEIKAREVVVIRVPMDTFTASRMMLTSIPVGSIMLTQNLVVFNEDDLLKESKKTMLETRFRNYPVVDEQNRVMGAISRFHLLGFSRSQVILVDHNELSQAVDGAEEAQIVEVVDHHRVGGVQTGEPILFRNEPLGATCTLVAKAYFEHGINLSKEMAGLLCAGILSDTMIFKSPTSTATDREIAERLSVSAGINLQEFGIKMLKEGASLIGLTPKEILNMDYKEFNAERASLGIGQVNTMSLDDMVILKESLLAEMELLRKQTGKDYILLMVTDLISEATELLISGESPEGIAKAFDDEIKDRGLYLPGVLSRKKQVVPPLMKYFS
ncbi:MAG TPA: putative manganese-dependent inorganic diphosphatase [Desulfobacteria bacterium]|nr:putative manganese-dependent inorganic diphosphatase [Desulfobacteria bacterium]